ncbi:4-(cytidine 5'-diphospho)-2-C-methyl-D-erythritol kinase [Solitalea koreensis]|uniref:4-diphosphocytidyl-2-C-methyl-D-erythritol kinase n=1 Tax=Solitalea koreensis TaxID=543615 RepID=A0A521D878_9SPHI|nr:4-(cytidine 5'-diphospho)-2-C-methyl-D-erythritol kinase [Solitalea koreensis]SMO67899.1 4-diphosphocytidyl-2-C-methyl-D-erythritol kinase [Solitalea koreensis]
MIVFPNAKINIGLNIVEKREDGFHNIETIFYPIKINDALEVIESEQTQFFSEGKQIPGNVEDNICLKAYHLLKHDFKLPPVHIHLLKNIPIGAGLGGGSSDGAYLIKLLNSKFNLQLCSEKMESYARKLGSDCAFFIENNPVFAVGKGDQFIDLELDLSKYFLVLVKPSIHVSTADAYGGCKPHKPLYSLQMLVRNPVSEWKNLIVNDFEDSVFTKYPEIKILKESLYESGALYVSMSGSGSSVYAFFSHQVNLPLIEANHQVFYNV